MLQAVLPEPWEDTPPPELMPAPPPTQDELPCDDGEPMETQRHKWQMDLLIETMDRWLAQRGEGYAGGNMFVYFDLAQTRGQYFRGPDFFVVLGAPRGERKCWVVWEEGKGPDVIIELLSPRTAAFDQDGKKIIYQNQLRVPEYYWFDPFDPEERAGFALIEGVYRAIPRDDQGRLWSQCLNLALVLWRGVYRGIEGTWLRWATLAGELLPTDAEAVQQQVEQERQRAERAEKQIEQLHARLRAMGVELEEE